MSKKKTFRLKLIKAYKLLGVHPWASVEVVNAAKSALLKKYHPDKCSTGLETFSTNICQSISEAHALILEHGKKASFDRQSFFTALLKSGEKNDSD